jgi:hypothetical protein
MTFRDWNAMTRQELLDEKGHCEVKLQTANLELRTAKRKAASGAGWMPLGELTALETRRLGLVKALRGINAQLAARKGEKLAKAFSEYFHDVADEILDDTLYNKIYYEAASRRKEDSNATIG